MIHITKDAENYLSLRERGGWVFWGDSFFMVAMKASNMYYTPYG